MFLFYNNIFDNNPEAKYGKSGYSAIIVAYDCLVDAGKSWEKLVIYAMINNFDSDTIGSIAGGLYGAVHGMKYVPKGNMKYIEDRETIIKTGSLLYEKYFKRAKK